MSEQFTFTTSEGHTVQFTTQNVSDETRRLIEGTLAAFQAKAAAYGAGEREWYCDYHMHCSPSTRQHAWGNHDGCGWIRIVREVE